MKMEKGLTKQNRSRKLNNKGAALIMVIVVISFVSIAATILLYMSAMNFYMKTTDKKTKECFYDGEAAIEQIRGTLMAYASDAAKDAYFEVMMEYGTTAPEDLQREFNELFVKNFKAKWAPVSVDINDHDQVLSYLVTIVDSKFSSCFAIDTSPCSVDETNGTFRLKNVEITYTDVAGYTTIISTDYVVQAPGINFSMDPSAMAASGGPTIDLVDYVTYNNYTKR